VTRIALRAACLLRTRANWKLHRVHAFPIGRHGPPVKWEGSAQKGGSTRSRLCHALTRQSLDVSKDHPPRRPSRKPRSIFHKRDPCCKYFVARFRGRPTVLSARRLNICDVPADSLPFWGHSKQQIIRVNYSSTLSPRGGPQGRIAPFAQGAILLLRGSTNVVSPPAGPWELISHFKYPMTGNPSTTDDLRDAAENASLQVKEGPKAACNCSSPGFLVCLL
jgi:hypothetical protein